MLSEFSKIQGVHCKCNKARPRAGFIVGEWLAITNGEQDYEQRTDYHSVKR